MENTTAEMPVLEPVLKKNHRLLISGIIVLILIVLGVVWYVVTPHADPLLTKTETAFNAGDLDAALVSADAFLAKNPNDVDALTLRASVLAQKGDLVGAEAGYQAALAIDHDVAEAHAGLGRILLGKGDADAALGHFMGAYELTKNPHIKAEARYSVGMIYIGKGRFARARGYFEEANALDPNYALGWYGLAVALFEQSRLKEVDVPAELRSKLSGASLQFLNQAIHLNAELSVAYLQMGVELAAMGRPEEALLMLEQAKTVVPKDSTLNALEKEAVLEKIATARGTIQKAGKKPGT